MSDDRLGLILAVLLIVAFTVGAMALAPLVWREYWWLLPL